jgi:hypothetical protein
MSTREVDPMNGILCRGLCLLLLSGSVASTVQGDEPYVYGKIVRNDRGREVPQSGLRVVLAQASTEGTPTYTSPYGTYGIYSLPGSPGEYELRVYLRQTLQKSKRVSITGRNIEVNVTLP